jgi:hypothetical protein
MHGQSWLILAALALLVTLAGCGGGSAGAPRPTDPPPTATPASIPPTATAAVQAATAEAARRAGVDPSRVQVVSAQAVDWPDTALGCPQPGHMYLQVITPGWRIQMTAGGQALTYHTNSNGSVVVTCTPP